MLKNPMALSEIVDRDYHAMVSNLRTEYQNIDPYLLVKSAMLRKKYPKESKQMFWLDIHFKEHIDEQSKSHSIYQQVGRLPTNHGHGHFVIDLQADLDTILLLGKDPDVERIVGEVYPL
jgi:hypothetical protein